MSAAREASGQEKIQYIKYLHSPFFVGTGKENHHKNKDFYPYRTTKIPGKEGKMLKKRNFKKSKERKDRVKIAEVSVAIPTLLFTRFGGDSAAILRSAPRFQIARFYIRSLKNYQCSTEGQKLQQNLAPVLAIISGTSLVFSRKIVTSSGFYRCCAPPRQQQHW